MKFLGLSPNYILQSDLKCEALKAWFGYLNMSLEPDEIMEITSH